GHLEVACKPKHFVEFQQAAETIANEFNHRLRIVPKEHLSCEIGSPIYHGGMVDETSAGVNPARYVAGLARAAERAGATIFERARVTAVERAGNNGAGGWKLLTARGRLCAREVLVATSGYTSGVTPRLQEKIIPIGSYIIVTEVLP